MSEKNILGRDLLDIRQNIGVELGELEGRKILFTGGAGFLGYEFLHLLASIGDEDGRIPVDLTIYENFSRGRKSWLSKLSEQSNVSLVEHDITDPLPECIPMFDYIIHAASIASPVFYRKNPIETIDANVNGLRHLLDYARKRGDRGKPILGMLFFSTSEIYGDPSPDAIPTPESYRGLVSCTGPRACYDESKRLGETLCVNFSQQYGIPIKVARPFNNYGPGLSINDRRVIPDLARDMLDGQDLVLLSDGLATRTFCYITDAISGYVKVLVSGRSGESYNIGTEEPEISMRQLAQMVAEIGKGELGYKGKVVFSESSDLEYLTDNPNRRCPNISKARIELMFSPKVNLQDGLKKSILWYSKNKL